MPQRPNQEFFSELLKRFKQVHGDTFDYSKAEYKGVAKKIEILCRKHGSFWQTPKNHQLGQGCPSCSNNQKKDLSTVVTEFKSVHGDKYSYDKCAYVDTDTPVEIVCHKHGSFWQKPTDHKRGRGCQQCGYDSMKTDLSVYLQQFQEKHPYRYEYDVQDAISLTSMIDIKCSKHGWFMQRVDHHLAGQGCPICNKNQHTKLRNA